MTPIDALRSINNLIGNRETIDADQLGQIRGLVLDTLNANAQPESPLNPEQRVRANASHQAREILAERGFASRGQVDPIAVITVARWIVEGTAPESIQTDPGVPSWHPDKP